MMLGFLLSMSLEMEDLPFMWHDEWHSLGPLLNHFTGRIVYASALHPHSRVANITFDLRWF